ncbi:DUF4011 domain-containing protein [Mycoplasma sp. P36-A1]|uniref:DUF4011 domain-containing protein n=1 Tax=Mycoplasma sp. P36-A1 TaxID=3252900 RepID=UPI003C2DF784
MNLDLFEQKNDYWNKKLLDLTKKNRMLNYKKRKTGSFEVEEEISTLYRALVDDEKCIEYSNVLPDKANYEDEEKYKLANDKVITQNKKLEYLRKQIRLANDEIGFNIGYMTFGMLNWYETSSDVTKDKPLQSPLILVPILIERENRKSSFIISKIKTDDAKINPVIIKKLKDDFGIDLNKDIEFSSYSEIVIEFKQKISQQVNWSIDETIIIDTFNFTNLVIQNDLETNKELLKNSKFINALIDEDGDLLYEDYNKPLDIKNIDVKRKLQILDADSSQEEAIERARRGDSFVLQGPPGTGKSQTITNIIGDQLGQGKRILFVSEKQAALNVVYEKLEKNNLADFCLILHDIKAKKSDIRTQLKNTMNLAESDYATRDDKTWIYDKLQVNINFLNEYDNILHSTDHKLQKSFYFVHGKLAPIINTKLVIFKIDDKIFNYSYNQIQGVFDAIKTLANTYLDNTQHHLNNN